jgi:hypothetical protein
MPTDEEPPADEEEEVVGGEDAVIGEEEEYDGDLAEVIVYPPEKEASGGPAIGPVGTAALAASLFLGAVGAFWTVA